MTTTEPTNSMSEDTTTTPNTTTPEAKELTPNSISELVSRVDLTGVTEHEIIVDLIAGIQQLAVRASIALGLLERIKVGEFQAERNAPETPENEPQEAPAATDNDSTAAIPDAEITEA